MAASGKSREAVARKSATDLIQKHAFKANSLVAVQPHSSGSAESLAAGADIQHRLAGSDAGQSHRVPTR